MSNQETSKEVELLREIITDQNTIIYALTQVSLDQEKFNEVASSLIDHAFYLNNPLNDGPKAFTFSEGDVAYGELVKEAAAQIEAMFVQEFQRGVRHEQAALVGLESAARIHRIFAGFNFEHARKARADEVVNKRHDLDSLQRQLDDLRAEYEALMQGEDVKPTDEPSLAAFLFSENKPAD